MNRYLMRESYVGGTMEFVDFAKLSEDFNLIKFTKYIKRYGHDDPIIYDWRRVSGVMRYCKRYDTPTAEVKSIKFRSGSEEAAGLWYLSNASDVC